MFNFSKDESPPPKCFFTHTVLPGYVDQKQPPLKKKPFSTILSQPFSHAADVILPEELYRLVRQELEGDVGTSSYARVHMPLGDVISGDFFNQYIKIGNILMLSEGRSGIDNVFSLQEGVLRLELDRPTYEKCGLVGQAISHGGRKHTKARFAVEYDLRQTSMVHGKKGFERLVWACKNVLTHSVTWLFHDLNTTTDDSAAPIHAHQPTLKSITPSILTLPATKAPPLSSIQPLKDPDYAIEVLEWLDMVSLPSPRLNASDNVDPFISRYKVPEPYVANASGPKAQIRNLVRLRWEGLVPAQLVVRIWSVLRQSVGEDWAAVS
ncbi:hypothetical protein K490DRAFT_3369, partial [Saccharata proteae CBS 121410]